MKKKIKNIDVYKNFYNLLKKNMDKNMVFQIDIKKGEFINLNIFIYNEENINIIKEYINIKTDINNTLLNIFSEIILKDINEQEQNNFTTLNKEEICLFKEYINLVNFLKKEKNLYTLNGILKIIFDSNNNEIIYIYNGKIDDNNYTLIFETINFLFKINNKFVIREIK